MDNNKKISEYFSDLLKNTKINPNLKKSIKNFILKGIVVDEKNKFSPIHKFSNSYETNYLMHFYFHYSSYDFYGLYERSSSNFNNKKIISKIELIKNNINIKIRNESWELYINIFKEFKIKIWNYLLNNKIAIKFKRDFFLNVYLVNISFSICMNSCLKSFYLDNINYETNESLNKYIDIMFKYFIGCVLEDILIDDCNKHLRDLIYNWILKEYSNCNKKFKNKTIELLHSFIKLRNNYINNIHLLNNAQSIISSEDGVIKLDLLRKLVENSDEKNSFIKIEKFFNKYYDDFSNFFNLKKFEKCDLFDNFNKLSNNIKHSSFISLENLITKNRYLIIKDLWLTCFKIIHSLTNSANHELDFVYKFYELLLDETFIFFNNDIIMSSIHSSLLLDHEKINKDDLYISINLEESKNYFFRLKVITIHDFFNVSSKKNNKWKIFQLIFNHHLNNNDSSKFDFDNDSISVYGYFLYLASITIIFESNHINFIVLIFLNISKTISESEFIYLINYLKLK